MSTPLVSVAMPSFNQGQFLRSTLQSVLDQSYENIELLVEDGGSADETKSILSETAAADPRLCYHSAPDDGPSDAINRAFSRVRGEYVGWLNSDDIYTPGTIQVVVNAFAKNPNWIMCYGHGEHIDAAGQVLNCYPTRSPQVGIQGFEAGCFICQPTVFFKTSMLTLIGNLDMSLKTAFDYDFWVRAFKAFPNRIGFIDTVLAQSRLHDDCITKRMRATVALEGMLLGLRHFNRASPHWATTYLEGLRTEMNGSVEAFQIEAHKFLSLAAEFLTPELVHQLKRSIQISPGE